MTGNRQNSGLGYACGAYHKETEGCRETDDYWIFWSLPRFISYFRDGICLDAEPEEEGDGDPGLPE